MDGPPLVRIVADFWPDRLLSDVRPVCADIIKARWPRWCSLTHVPEAHRRHSWCQCNLRKLARIDRSVLPSTASCKFVGYPPSNLARGRISDHVMSAWRLPAGCTRRPTSSSAKRCGQTCWPRPPRPASAASAPAARRAMVWAYATALFGHASASAVAPTINVDRNSGISGLCDAEAGAFAGRQLNGPWASVRAMPQSRDLI